MNKDEAKAALLAGSPMLFSRASMGTPAMARIDGQPVRIDTARRLMKELNLQSDKPYGLTKTYRLPRSQPGGEAPNEEQADAPSTRSRTSPSL